MLTILTLISIVLVCSPAFSVVELISLYVLQTLHFNLRDYIAQQTLTIQKEVRERELTERILKNILPPSICARLKTGEKGFSDRVDDVTIFFCDIVQFTKIASKLSVEELIEFLSDVFEMLDKLTEIHGVERIKTIGDAYLAVGGLFHPESKCDGVDPAKSSANNVLRYSLDVADVLKSWNLNHKYPFEVQLRIGIHTGSVVAGIITSEKMAFDVWGDAVNIASRMETQGIPGMIQVTETTYNLTKDLFRYQKRGDIWVKGKGIMTTYFLQSKSPPPLYVV
jgi:class 3 adenylate cyclase